MTDFPEPPIGKNQMTIYFGNSQHLAGNSRGQIIVRNLKKDHRFLDDVERFILKVQAACVRALKLKSWISGLCDANFFTAYVDADKISWLKSEPQERKQTRSISTADIEHFRPCAVQSEKPQ